MGAMQNYVMRCDVRSWRASGVMFDKTYCDRRSNNDQQDSLLVLVDEYLVEVSSQRQRCSGALSQKLPWTSSGGRTGDFSFEIVEQRRVD